MIKCKNLSYQNILKKISFNLQRGKIAVLVGLKGCGKTTLLDCLMGNLEAKGDITLDHCRYLKELPTFCEELTGNEYIELLMLFSEAAIKTEINLLIKELYLEKELTKKIKDVNLFTRKFLILISSFCLDSRTILIDEPFCDFDFNTQKQVIEAIKKLKALGKTVIIATNDLDSGYHVADQFLVLHNSKISQVENNFINHKQYEEKILALLMN